MVHVKRRSARKHSGRIYTTGQLNLVVDSLLHPLFEQNTYFMILDGLLHAIIEQDPAESLQKFIKYDSPKLVERIIRERQKRRPLEDSSK